MRNWAESAKKKKKKKKKSDFLKNIESTVERTLTKRAPIIYVIWQNKKNNVYPFKPQFYYIKVGLKGVKFI